RILPVELLVLPIQPRLLSIERTPVRKVVLAWAFYRYPSPFYRYNQSATDTLKTSTKTGQVSSQSSTSPALLPIP
ncbi:hypothetical protein Golob_004618, partial [Gossypium lobatum]|nr:hypothetical protein [Gossypium lobatum]